MVTIVDGKKRIPYMRGMLVYYLLARGFAQDEAYDVADAVRRALSKRKSVTKKEVVQLIDRFIHGRYGERPVGDLVFWERLPTNITVERRDGSWPFSKEVLSRSIQASGLPPDQAYKLARTVESMLIDQRRSRIAHRELRRMVEFVLEQQHGPDYAERYRVWRTWGDLDRPLIILIGGASGVGKTSLAISLAHVLDIPRVVATDDIRQVMRLMLSPALMPAIHTSSYTAWSQITVPSSSGMDPVVTGFREQAKIVSVGVRAILSRCLEELTSVIIDGVHLLPDFIDTALHAKSGFLVQLGLSLEDRKAYEKRFAQRATASPARPRHRYMANLEEILKIQEHIVACHALRNLPVIDTQSVPDVTSAAVMVVVEQLQEQEEVRRALQAPRKKGKRKRKARAKRKG